MIKSFLILLIISIHLFSSEQIILVVSDNMSTSKAKLECYEDGKKVFDTIDVNLGKNGLGWGIGEYNFPLKKGEVLKYEGDKKAPAGIFKLSDIFGYAKNGNYKMPYLFASEDLICVDDTHSPFYNQIIQAHGDEKSFEHMKRDDNQYTIGVVVKHNPKAQNKRGSCIFLHIEKFQGAGTAGCTSMKYNDLKKIVNWLDKKKKPLLIQIPKERAGKVIELFPQLKESKLLK